MQKWIINRNKYSEPKSVEVQKKYAKNALYSRGFRSSA